MKLHEDEHSVTSIIDIVNNIYVGSHKKNVKIMIANSSNSLSHGKSGKHANVMCSYLATYRTATSTKNQI